MSKDFFVPNQCLRLLHEQSTFASNIAQKNFDLLLFAKLGKKDAKLGSRQENQRIFGLHRTGRRSAKCIFLRTKKQIML